MDKQKVLVICDRIGESFEREIARSEEIEYVLTKAKDFYGEPKVEHTSFVAPHKYRRRGQRPNRWPR